MHEPIGLLEYADRAKSTTAYIFDRYAADTIWRKDVVMVTSTTALILTKAVRYFHFFARDLSLISVDVVDLDHTECDFLAI